MSKKKFQALIVPVDTKPYLMEVQDELEYLQLIVGGQLEYVACHDEEGFVIMCNGEGKLLGLEPNIWLGLYSHDYLAGQFFVCKADEEGEMVSLSKKEAENFLYKYVVGRKYNPRFNIGKWDL
jgi:hypothetical protein